MNRMSSSGIGPARPGDAGQQRIPVRGIVAGSRGSRRAGARSLAARQDGQQLRLAGQVEPRDDAFVAMLDQEATAVAGKRADQLKLVRGEAEARRYNRPPAPSGWP